MWSRLRDNADFQGIWTSGPLAAEMAALEREIRDPGVTDYAAMLAAKAKLYAFNRVQAVVNEMAERERTQPLQESDAMPVSMSRYFPNRPR